MKSIRIVGIEKESGLRLSTLGYASLKDEEANEPVALLARAANVRCGELEGEVWELKAALDKQQQRMTAWIFTFMTGFAIAAVFIAYVYVWLKELA